MIPFLIPPPAGGGKNLIHKKERLKIMFPDYSSLGEMPACLLILIKICLYTTVWVNP